MINDLLLPIASWMKSHNSAIALAMIATLLVVFGNNINRAVRGLVVRQHFLVRITVFILLCTFGYGALTVWLTPVLAGFLISLKAIYYVPLVAGGFIALGLLAEGYHKR